MRKLFFIFIITAPIVAFTQPITSSVDKPSPNYFKNAIHFTAQLEDINIIFKQDMENATLGSYIKDEWSRDWNNPPWSTRLSETTIIEKDGSKVFRWVYPEGSVGSNESGGQWETPIPGGFHTEIYMSYNVMFRPGFDFVLAGKIPGLKGGPFNWIAGVEKPHFDSGWLGGCLMKGQSNPRGYIAFYPYHQDQLGLYGDSYHFLDPYSSDDLYYIKDDNVNEKWINITLRIVMNTVKPDGSGGNNDGIFEGYIDGRLMVQYTKIRYRNLSSIGIDNMKVYSFFGGNTDAFAATRDEWALFDDFYLFTYADGVDVPRGNTPSLPGRDLGIPWLKYAQVSNPDADTDPPTVPENVQIKSATPNSMSVTWDAATDSVGVAGYRIFKDNVLEDAETGNSYQITDLDPNTSYLISVSAYDAATNESEQSFPVIGTTLEQDEEPPTTPTGIEVTHVSGYSIEFNWEPSQDNVGVTLYEIQLNGKTFALVPATSYVAGGLDPGTAYEITIRALDAIGNVSAFSEPVSQTTGAADHEAPTMPAGLKSEGITKQTIGLTWTPATDNVAVKGYKIYVNNEFRDESTSNDEVIGGLNAGLTYTISVSAFDEALNESPKSNAITVTTTNDDFTTNPTLPEVYILEVESRSSNPGSVSEMKSLGYAELDAYGIMVTQGDQMVEEGEPLFADNSLSTVRNEGRITNGLQALYNFSDNEGSNVTDISGVGEPLNLHINRPLNATWLKGQGLNVTANTTISYEGTPTRLIEALAKTNEITLEAWVKQNVIHQTDLARMITLSSSSSLRAATLGHEGNVSSYNYETRLNTTNTDANGLPSFATTTNFTSLSLHHVVYTRNRQGVEKLYVNGIELSSGTRVGDFSSWNNDYRLTLGNEPSGDRPWKGIFYLVAIYDQALDADEVIHNYESGFGQIQYSTDLSNLEPNVPYQLSPFVRTDQGIVYGEKKSFMIENVLFSDENDSLYIAVYPNPSNGDFKLHIEYNNNSAQTAHLRIANMSGVVLYSRELEASDNDVDVNIDEDILLASQIQEGFYSLIFILGTHSIARKLIIHK